MKQDIVMNLTNVTFETYYATNPDTIHIYQFQEIINQYCHNWRNTSTYAHNFYAPIIFLFWGIGLLRTFLKLQINYDITLFYLNLTKLPIPFLNKINERFYIAGELLTDIQKLAITVIIIRIMQVWYITNHMGLM